MPKSLHEIPQDRGGADAGERQHALHLQAHQTARRAGTTGDLARSRARIRPAPEAGCGRRTARRRSGLERTCKPGSVPRRPRAAGDDHFSRAPVARGLEQPTRKRVRDGRLAPLAPEDRDFFLLGLAPDGVCRARPVTRPAGELLPHRFTLTARAAEAPPRRFVFCGTVPGLAAGGRYPPSCPVEPGLSSRRGGGPAEPADARGRRSPGPLQSLRPPIRTVTAILPPP